MKNIDFLPERYQERALKRKAAIWQYALLLGFGGLLLAATIGQFAIKHSLRTSLAELKQSRIDTNLKRGAVELLKQELGSTEEEAALYTYLRHPWPRTQLLAKITELLPESVVLEGIEIFGQHPNASSSAFKEEGDGAKGATPAAKDLAQLRSDLDATQLVVRVRGTVEDPAKLNEYVEQLSRVALFRAVSLNSLQSKASPDATPRSAFELKVTVRPGHGQPEGPNGPFEKRDPIVRFLLVRQPQ